jgi:hypothetical protein
MGILSKLKKQVICIDWSGTTDMFGKKWDRVARQAVPAAIAMAHARRAGGSGRAASRAAPS